MVELNKEDKELKEIFSGEERELHPDTVHVTLGKPQKVNSNKGSTNTTNREKTSQTDPHKPTHNFDGKSWEPIKERTWADSLKEGTKWVAVFGGLSVLLWYWQVSGLMDSSVAVPSMCACTALAGWNLGKCARG